MFNFKSIYIKNNKFLNIQKVRNINNILLRYNNILFLNFFSKKNLEIILNVLKTELKIDLNYNNIYMNFFYLKDLNFKFFNILFYNNKKNLTQTKFFFIVFFFERDLEKFLMFFLNNSSIFEKNFINVIGILFKGLFIELKNTVCFINKYNYFLNKNNYNNNFIFLYKLLFMIFKKLYYIFYNHIKNYSLLNIFLYD